MATHNRTLRHHKADIGAPTAERPFTYVANGRYSASAGLTGTTSATAGTTPSSSGRRAGLASPVASEPASPPI